jgi:hypothetical protein
MNIIGQLTFVAINNGGGSKTRGVGAGQGRWQLMATFRNLCLADQHFQDSIARRQAESFF